MRENPHLRMGILDCRKSPLGLSDSFLQSAARLIIEQLPLAIVNFDSLRDAPHLQPVKYLTSGTCPEVK